MESDWNSGKVQQQALEREIGIVVDFGFTFLSLFHTYYTDDEKTGVVSKQIYLKEYSVILTTSIYSMNQKI